MAQKGVIDFLQLLSERGIAVSAQDSEICIVGKGEEPEDFNQLLEEIRKWKPEILWHLQGWILLYSNLLGELIVVVKDACTEIPERLKPFPRYEFREVRALKGYSPEHLIKIHKVKKIFKGKVETP